MDYLKNHCWCSDSNWGGMYDCQIIVNLSCYEDYDKEDWNNLFTKERYFSQEEYEKIKKIYNGKEYYTDDFYRSMSTKDINVLKPEVYQWLLDNVPDSEDNEKMWCIGSRDYLFQDSYSSFSFFFQRRKDAMKFIKTWSIHKKPVYYTQYFTDVRKKLNFETMKYEDR